MGISKRQIRALIVVGIILGAVGVPVLAAVLDNSVQVSGGVPVAAPDGPVVTLEGDTNASLSEPFPDANTVDLVTEDGNVTFTSVGETNATIHRTDITGEWTNVTGLDVSSNELYINPEDKRAINVSGDVDRIEFRDTTLDDDEVDFVYAGTSGTTTVTVRGVAADTDIGAIDQNGNLLATGTSDSSGTVTLTGMPNSEHEVKLVESENGPTTTNATPTGDLDSEPSDLSVDVSDPDMPEDNVTVTISLDGSQVHQETIGSNQTVNTSIPSSGQTGGEHDWTVEMEDEYGQTATESYTYRVPKTLFIRNETNPSELIDSPIDVTVRFFGDDQTFTRNTTSGTINMTGLPVDEDFTVTVDASENYTARTVYIQSIYDQQDVYLLNQNESTVETRFILTDPTGQFPEQTVLYISKPIEDNGTTEYRTVYADVFGVEGVTATLDEGERYRLRIEAPDGTTQDMGVYRADTSETVELRPRGPAVEFDEYEEGWATDAELTNRTLEVHYSDPEGETDSLTVWIHERGNESNQLEPNETYFDLGNLSTQYTLTENESEKEWVVNYDIDRDGEDLHKQVIVANRLILTPDDMSREWRLIIGIGLLFLSGGAFSLLNRGVGAIMVGLEGGILWYTGWLEGATTAAAVAIYLFVAVVYNIYLSQN